MELKNKNIKIDIDNGTINSIKYKDQEIIYQKNGSWKKTFPIIWPVVGYSDSFIVNGQNYEIPKHGIWNKLEWEYFIENKNLVGTSIHMADDIYPWTMDIQQFISLSENGLQIETTIANVSKDDAYFHFGLHPAFIIDEKSELKYSSNKYPECIELNGEIIGNTEKDMKPFSEMPFSKKYDTLVFKDVDFDECSFFAKDINITLKHDANNLQLWKPADDDFICIEPWYGVSDREYKLIKEAKNKKEIIKVSSGDRWNSIMTLEFKK